MQYLYEWADALLGSNAPSLSAKQMCFRAVVVYIIAWLMLRLVGDRRFAGKYAAIDTLLSITLGATLSRAINGSAAFLPTITASAALVSIHWLVSAVSFRLPQLEPWIKGRRRILIQDGQINRQALQASHLTEYDLEMALRLKTNLTDLDQIALANMEPNGDISIITRADMKVIELPVQGNVKTVRVLLE